MESSCFRGKINIILCFLSGKSYSLQPDAGVGRQHLYAIGGGGEPDSLPWPNSLKNRESESAPVVELCQWNAVVCKLLNVVVRVKFMSSISGKRCVHVCFVVSQECHNSTTGGLLDSRFSGSLAMRG